MKPFFVYGTLLPGQPNHYLWGKSIVTMETAVFPHGRLYDMGNYPMMVEQQNEPVKGKLITVSESSYEAITAVLDALEGFDPEKPTTSAYRRLERVVECENGRFVTAWLYLGQPKFVRGLPSIPSGDWVKHISATMQQINSWWTSTNSVAGLHE